MAGITLELNAQATLGALRKAVAQLENPQPMFNDMGEYLLRSHSTRFKQQQTPDGQPWTPLSPRYKKQKKKNADRILFLDGYLANTLRYQTSPSELQFGSNRPYAALMHFGGVVQTGKGQANHPSREFLGVSERDAQRLNKIALKYLQAAF